MVEVRDLGLPDLPVGGTAPQRNGISFYYRCPVMKRDLFELAVIVQVGFEGSASVLEG
jgi:hypothetical protein